MLLQFHSEEDFKDFFDEETHTVHNGPQGTYRFSGRIPDEYPVFLQSGRKGIISEEVFRVINQDVFQKRELEAAKEQAALFAEQQRTERRAI